MQGGTDYPSRTPAEAVDPEDGRSFALSLLQGCQRLLNRTTPGCTPALPPNFP